MRIQHNIAALNSHRNLTNNNSAVAKNLEKLSSGYRINRAGDDAAGLAISEKMRAQITGLETAQKNAQDGISLVQTAEGALTEVHSMLNRMVELADQSANGTYSNEIDRQNLQKEITSLKDEINRISKATNFNGINLLDGSLGGARVTSTPGAAGTVTPGDKAVYSVAFTALTDGQSFELDGITVTAADNDASGGIDSVATTGAEDQAKILIAKYNADTSKDYKASWDDTNGEILLTAKNSGVVTTAPQAGATAGNMTEEVAGTADTTAGATAGSVILNYANNPKAGDTLTVGGTTYEFVKDGETQKDATATAITIGADTKTTVANLEAELINNTDIDGTDITVDATGTVLTLKTAAGAADVSKPVEIKQEAKGLTLQIGDTADEFNQISVKVGSMSADSLGIGDIDISTQEGATDAIQKIKDAINEVSSTRGGLGAIQNRLEHTINNLSVTTENMTAAESRIRDVDMAKEMMAYTKNNILVQASQAMLAQANQLPQGVLQLLQ